MGQVIIFYLEHCPYCVKARRAVEELRADNAALNALDIEWIEESRQPDVADRYDYYRVPTVYVDGEKLYECSPSHDYDAIREHIRAALGKAV